MRQMVMVTALAWLTFSGFSQTGGSAFAWAAVKPSGHAVGKDARGQFTVAADRLSARNVSLEDLILEAYHLERYQVSGGPAWLDSDEFDVDARAGAAASKEQLRL